MISINQLTTLSMMPIHNAAAMHTAAIDSTLPKERRILKFINDTQNPYCLRVGDNTVKMCFSANGRSIQDGLVKSTIGKSGDVMYNRGADIATQAIRHFPPKDLEGELIYGA